MPAQRPPMTRIADLLDIPAMDPATVEAASLLFQDEFGSVVPFAIDASPDQRTLRVRNAIFAQVFDLAWVREKESRGELQCVVESLQRLGDGSLYELFLQLKARLAAAGLFDSPSDLPYPITLPALSDFPTGIGVKATTGLPVVFPSLPMEREWRTARLERLSDARRNFILLNMPAEYQQRLVAPGRARAAVAILVAMVACMAFGWLPGADAA